MFGNFLTRLVIIISLSSILPFFNLPKFTPWLKAKKTSLYLLGCSYILRFSIFSSTGIGKKFNFFLFIFEMIASGCVVVK